MDEITIIMPCYRIKHIDRVYESLVYSCRNFDKTPLFLIILDSGSILHVDEYIHDKNIRFLSHTDPLNVKGNSQRNFALDYVKTKYLMYHDDDNFFHPNFFNVIIPMLKYDKNIIVGQYRGNNRWFDAKPEMVKPGLIDIAQVVLKTELMRGEVFIPDVNQDGYMFEKLYNRNPSDFIFHEEYLTLYNSYC